jgi:hypothetical protein
MYKFNERKNSIRSKNVGNWDAVLRVLIGSLLIIVGFATGNYWGLIGLVLIITGGLSWCPIYKIFGIQTCKPDIESAV